MVGTYVHSSVIVDREDGKGREWQTQSSPGSIVDAWWNVPDLGFYAITLSCSAMAVVGLIVCKNERARCCKVSLAWHAFLIAAGWILILVQAA